MKQFVVTFVLILFDIALMAQVPAGFSYQAVVRNNEGDVVANQSVKFRISILRDSETGTAVYVETHSVQTNAFGLANLKVGMGTSVSGSFTPDGWGATNHFMKVELDPNNGSTFSHLGTTQLIAVPYAFHAQTVEIDQVDDADADASNEIQELELSGTVLGLSKSSKTVILPSSGGGDNWGTQTVQTDTTLTGEGTGSSPLGIVHTAVTPEWDNIQDVPEGFADGTDDVDDADSNATNELQNLSLEVNTLQLSESEATVDLSPYLDNTDSQTLSISGTNLTISSGNTVTLPSSGGGDNWGTEVVHTDVTLEGQGTTSAPLKIARQSAANGQVLKWNGTTWLPENDNSGSSYWQQSGNDIYFDTGKVGIGPPPRN